MASYVSWIFNYLYSEHPEILKPPITTADSTSETTEEQHTFFTILSGDSEDTGDAPRSYLPAECKKNHLERCGFTKCCGSYESTAGGSNSFGANVYPQKFRIKMGTRELELNPNQAFAHRCSAEDSTCSNDSLRHSTASPVGDTSKMHSLEHNPLNAHKKFTRSPNTVRVEQKNRGGIDLETECYSPTNPSVHTHSSQTAYTASLAPIQACEVQPKMVVISEPTLSNYFTEGCSVATSFDEKHSHANHCAFTPDIGARKLGAMSKLNRFKNRIILKLQESVANVTRGAKMTNRAVASAEAASDSFDEAYEVRTDAVKGLQSLYGKAFEQSSVHINVEHPKPCYEAQQINWSLVLDKAAQDEEVLQQGVTLRKSREQKSSSVSILQPTFWRNIIPAWLSRLKQQGDAVAFGIKTRKSRISGLGAAEGNVATTPLSNSSRYDTNSHLPPISPYSESEALSYCVLPVGSWYVFFVAILSSLALSWGISSAFWHCSMTLMVLTTSVFLKKWKTPALLLVLTFGVFLLLLYALLFIINGMNELEAKQLYAVHLGLSLEEMVLCSVFLICLFLNANIPSISSSSAIISSTLLRFRKLQIPENIGGALMCGVHLGLFAIFIVFQNYYLIVPNFLIFASIGAAMVFTHQYIWLLLLTIAFIGTTIICTVFAIMSIPAAAYQYKGEALALSAIQLILASLELIAAICLIRRTPCFKQCLHMMLNASSGFDIEPRGTKEMFSNRKAGATESGVNIAGSSSIAASSSRKEPREEIKNVRDAKPASIGPVLQLPAAVESYAETATVYLKESLGSTPVVETREKSGNFDDCCGEEEYPGLLKGTSTASSLGKGEAHKPISNSGLKRATTSANFNVSNGRGDMGCDALFYKHPLGGLYTSKSAEEQLHQKQEVCGHSCDYEGDSDTPCTTKTEILRQDYEPANITQKHTSKVFYSLIQQGLVENSPTKVGKVDEEGFQRDEDPYSKECDRRDAPAHTDEQQSYFADQERHESTVLQGSPSSKIEDKSTVIFGVYGDAPRPTCEKSKMVIVGSKLSSQDLQQLQAMHGGKEQKLGPTVCGLNAARVVPIERNQGMDDTPKTERVYTTATFSDGEGVSGSTPSFHIGPVVHGSPDSACKIAGGNQKVADVSQYETRKEVQGGQSLAADSFGEVELRIGDKATKHPENKQTNQVWLCATPKTEIAGIEELPSEGRSAEQKSLELTGASIKDGCRIRSERQMKELGATDSKELDAPTSDAGDDWLMNLLIVAEAFPDLTA